jgi:hypothetical protein
VETIISIVIIIIIIIIIIIVVANAHGLYYLFNIITN